MDDRAIEVVGSNGITLNIQWSLEESCWDYTFYDGRGHHDGGGQFGGFTPLFGKRSDSNKFVEDI